MTKSLSERIAKRAASKTARQGKNRAVVMALRTEIEQALNDGWSVRAVWDTLRAEGKIDVSYQGFCNYIRQLVARKAPQHTKATGPQRKGQLPGFKFNATPNKEDLL